MINVLFAASEAVPFIKTGGLADVVGSLPKYFNKKEYDVRIVMPKYTCIADEYQDKMEYMTNYSMDISWRSQYVGIFKIVEEGLTFYFIDNEYYFKTDYPYHSVREDLEKFAFFSKAVLSILPVVDFRPDIIHCHDWQSALIPVYLNDSFQGSEFFRGIKTIMTIHNLRFQGTWDVATIQDITGLSDYYFTSDKLESYRDGNYLKGGIVYADAITTVSRTYAKEITTPYYGESLDGLLKAREDSLRGITNGIDYKVYDPSHDPLIEYNYDLSNFRKHKIKNKKALQRELGLDRDPKVLLLGIVSRLTDQKGIDLIAYIFDELFQDAVQLVVLGTGEERYENMFRHFEWKYQGRVSTNICYNDTLSHKVFASCDALLVPSLFEPCGLTQLMALRYGTLPIVRQTGGLADTVEPYNKFDGTGTGFGFLNYNAHELLGAIRYAMSIYYDKKREWNKIIERAMASDFSWEKSAMEYEEMYSWLADLQCEE